MLAILFSYGWACGFPILGHINVIEDNPRYKKTTLRSMRAYALTAENSSCIPIDYEKTTKEFKKSIGSLLAKLIGLFTYKNDQYQKLHEE